MRRRLRGGARGRRLRRRRRRRQLLSLQGRWRRQLVLSLLGCRCAGAHCSTNRCMGQAVRDGWRASKPAIYASPSIFLVMFNPPAGLGARSLLSVLCEMSPHTRGGEGATRQCDRSVSLSEGAGCTLYGRGFEIRTSQGGLLPTVNDRPS